MTCLINLILVRTTCTSLLVFIHQNAGDDVEAMEMLYAFSFWMFHLELMKGFFFQILVANDEVRFTDTSKPLGEGWDGYETLLKPWLLTLEQMYPKSV